MMKKKSSSFLLLPLSALMLAWGVAALPQSPFLHEILLGRCYEKPVGGDPSLCPSIVGSLLEAFAGKLDQDVRTADFKPYLDAADFSSPKNGGIFVMGGRHNHGDDHLRIKNHTRPEDTPGGALVAGLTFCASDQHEHCPGIQAPKDGEEFTGAASSLWAGIYQAFARQVQGQLLMVVLDESADTTLTVQAAIPHFNTNAVSEVDIFLVQGDCDASRAVSQLQHALHAANITKISCVQDPYLLNVALCAGSLATQESCQLAKHVNDKAADSSEASKKANTTTADTENGEVDDVDVEGEDESNSNFWNTCLVVLLVAAGVIFFVEKQQKYHKAYDEIPQTHFDQ